MNRRIVQTKGETLDREQLVILTIYEPDYNKEKAKKEGILSKQHDVLIWTGESYRYRH